MRHNDSIIIIIRNDILSLLLFERFSETFKFLIWIFYALGIYTTSISISQSDLILDSRIQFSKTFRAQISTDRKIEIIKCIFNRNRN